MFEDYLEQLKGKYGDNFISDTEKYYQFEDNIRIKYPKLKDIFLENDAMFGIFCGKIYEARHITSEEEWNAFVLSFNSLPLKEHTVFKKNYLTTKAESHLTNEKYTEVSKGEVLNRLKELLKDVCIFLENFEDADSLIKDIFEH